MSITHLIKRHLPYVAKICTLCQQYHDNTHAVCEFCQDLFTPLGLTCQRCAIPITTGSRCSKCLISTAYIDRVIVAYAYKEPLRTLLHRFKYQQGLYLQTVLIHLLQQAPFDVSSTDCLMPVPIHPQRLRQRGFNQAGLLAKRLAKHYDLPYLANRCKRVVNSLPQARLDNRQRQSNLKNAFRATAIPYTRVTLIDDLYTTGSTANEIAKILKEQGVLKVDIWCCARTI